MPELFEGVAPWPEAENPRAANRHDNQPPLEERLAMDYEDDLRAAGLIERLDTIVASAGRVPEITDGTVAGKVGDLIALARVARKAVEDAREKHNRPLLNAQRALKGRQDGLLAPMDAAVQAVKTKLDAYMAEERRKADKARAEAAEAARFAQAEADKLAREAAAENRPAPPPPVIAPAVIEAPVARGDMGARVGTKTVWRHKIDSVRQLPDAILKNERVLEALDKVVAAQIRGGTRAIKGVTIWDEQVADVR